MKLGIEMKATLETFPSDGLDPNKSCWKISPNTKKKKKKEKKKKKKKVK